MDDENMSEITQEVFDTFPEAAQSAFVKDEQSGLFVTNDSLKFAGAKKNLDTLHTEVNSFKQREQEQVNARELREKEIADEAYAKAIADNDQTKLNEINEQKLNDALDRAGKSEEKFNNLQQGLATEKESTIIDALSEHGTKQGKAALKRLLKGYVKVDPETGAETYLNDDGSASSLDRNGFITEQLRGNPVFESLVQGELPSNSPNLPNGNTRSDSQSGSKTLTREQFESIPQRERAKFIKDGGKIA